MWLSLGLKLTKEYYYTGWDKKRIKHRREYESNTNTYAAMHGHFHEFSELWVSLFHTDSSTCKLSMLAAWIFLSISIGAIVCLCVYVCDSFWDDVFFKAIFILAKDYCFTNFSAKYTQMILQTDSLFFSLINKIYTTLSEYCFVWSKYRLF